MTSTILTNLALSKLGQTLVKSLGDTTSREARLASLHYEPCLREALRAHFWSFAMTTRPLEAVDVRDLITVTGPLKLGSTSLSVGKLFLDEDLVEGKDAFSEEIDADSPVSATTLTWSADDEWVMVHGGTGAIWKRAIDVASPELTALRPHFPKHFFETALSGDHNDLHYEQVDQAAAPAQVEYLAPAAAAVTAATVAGRTLTIVPGTKARMEITDVGDTGVNGMLFYAGYFNEDHHWTNNGLSYEENLAAGNDFVVLYRDAPNWILRRVVDGFPAPYDFRKNSATVFPDGLVFDDPVEGTDPPTVTAFPSTALQVLAAVENSSPTTLRITGTLAYAGTPVVPPLLKLAGTQSGRPIYTDTGALAGSAWVCFRYISSWLLFQIPFGSAASWSSSDDVASPDLVTTWTPDGISTTGT
ncbi:MAG: hypothetical protein EOP85_13175, partial [Verrucomicrobiaceae bacterium]